VRKSGIESVVPRRLGPGLRQRWAAPSTGRISGSGSDALGP